ncbi:MAG: protein arginine kinase [Verrucomicrobiales bacterium]|nr:protein arginine kinase [Verrucomicrobiales bacterium]|tara:strand:+ start:4924 stop:6000 length:1077 start_codon:yes stop_codon:yes gene_type:complete
MNLEEYLASPVCAKPEGPEDRIVMSSRVRLARNLRDHAFPTWAKQKGRIESLQLIRPAVESLPKLDSAFSAGMEELATVDKQILVERHLISREHAAKKAGSGVVFVEDESICVMINEEDHLRMQAILPGLQVQEAWKVVDELDTQLEEKLEFAATTELGYLTACPTNLGTAIRVSAMLHLPGLVLAEQINQIITSVQKLGLAVRGLYGEGTEALGNVFQVSNQRTLGESEAEITERLGKVLRQIIENEENARATLLEDKPHTVYNHIGRAYGILANAHIIASKETMNLLSLLRLGVDLGMFKGLDRGVIDELFLITQPAHLQKQHTDKLDAEERDVRRAEMLRTRLRKIERPRIPKNK